MDIDLLKSFIAVAEARSFSRAAETSHWTQSTLSRHISRLETEMGAKLFQRYGRHVECTAAGEVLLPLARAVVARTEEAVTLVREQAGAGSGTVRFGATGNVFALLLTPILVSFIAGCPDASFELIEQQDSQMDEAVMSGELDCAVMTAWGSIRSASYHLVNEEILLLVPADHRLARERTVRIDMLAGESVLLPRTTMNAGNVVSDALRRAGLKMKFSYRANYPEFTKALVKKGLGVAPVPGMLADPATLDGLVVIPFEEKLSRDLVLIYPRDRPLSGTVRSLIRHVRAAFLPGIAGRDPRG